MLTAAYIGVRTASDQDSSPISNNGILRQKERFNHLCLRRGISFVYTNLSVGSVIARPQTLQTQHVVFLYLLSQICIMASRQEDLPCELHGRISEADHTSCWS